MRKASVVVVIAVVLLMAGVFITLDSTEYDPKTIDIRFSPSLRTAAFKNHIHRNMSNYPECGKICSYIYDSSKSGTFYPLLRKEVNCTNILRRMASPPYNSTIPPPRRPPKELISNYTQNGKCPIKYYTRYVDDSHGARLKVHTDREFKELLLREQRSNINPYRDSNIMKTTLLKYHNNLINKSVVVIGTQKPWLEAMLVNRGASKVTTVDYNSITIQHERIMTTTPTKLAETLQNASVLFDAAASYSSLEHTGIGRYGDPLMPYGDLEAAAQVWCMVKSGGLFFLAVPVYPGRKRCFYQWNVHRMYGEVRLQHLTANWQVLEEIVPRRGHNVLYVLRKVEDKLS